ncbi:MAG TPA: hypothetical protein VJK03_05385 [Candidatus Nanoarchaeia archaeon]|nr:hypothetical protein [Candidatus Nanoarchaeia archaeon]
MKNLILFDADEINQIITIGGENLRRRTLEPIERAINVLKTMPDLKLLDVEHVIFRVATLQALLDSMRETLGEKVYKDVMRQAGENIGASFAKDLINFLITAGRFPQDEKTLIRLWNELDTTANWGKFSTKYEDGQIVVAIKENFLTRGKTQNQHQYCSFMEGYIQGFLWYALKDYYQWFKQNVTQPATRPLQPTKIIEKQADGVCTFIVELEEEKLPDAFDLFGDAKAAYSAGDFSKSANHLRSAIEIAFKLKLGIEKENPTSIIKILKALKKNNVQLDYNKIDDIYAKTSQAIHGIKKLAKDECTAMLEEADSLLKTLELMPLDDERKGIIIEEMKKL